MAAIAGSFSKTRHSGTDPEADIAESLLVSRKLPCLLIVECYTFVIVGIEGVCDGCDCQGLGPGARLEHAMSLARTSNLAVSLSGCAK